MLLLVAGGLNSLRLPLTAYAHYKHSGGQSQTSKFVARFEKLRPCLPDHGVIGYFCELPGLSLPLTIPGRKSLAQYALSPPTLELDTRHPFVIFDTDDPQIACEAAVRENWRLIVDLQNGVRLYRTQHRD